MMSHVTSRWFAAVVVLGLAVNIGFAVVERAGWGIKFPTSFIRAAPGGHGPACTIEGLAKIEVESETRVPTGRLPLVACG